MHEFEAICDRGDGSADASGYRVKVIRSGPVLEIELYPYHRGPEKKQRAKKAQETEEAKERWNRGNSMKRAARLANANFGPEDLAIRLSYRDKPTGEQAQKDLQNYIKRINRRRKKAGLPPAKYMYSTEWQTPGGRESKRIHHHLIISGGLERDEIEKAWGLGYANTERLQFDEYGITGKALYIAGHPKKYRRWSCSKNLEKPKEKVYKIALSARKVGKIAKDVEEARAFAEGRMKKYRFVNRDEPRYSSVVSGAYIHITMRRII